MLKEGSKIYVPKTGFILELKSEEFIKEQRAKGIDVIANRWAEVGMANYAVEQGWAEVISE
jgi:hypothetical protein